MEAIQDSLETESGDYSIIVRSPRDLAYIMKMFASFDDDTKIESLYTADAKNYFEVFLGKDSIFRQEMLEDIESGILPESFVGIEIKSSWLNYCFMNNYENTY